MVTNGEQAIESIRRNDYAAIVLDLMLPVTNGFEVLQFVRAERPALMRSIVVMTAASNRTLHHFDETSVGALVRKPFDLDVLLETISDVSRTEWPDARAGETTQRTSSYRVH